VIETGDNEVFLQLPGVIVAESSTGETRYLLSDGLGSVRHATDENGAVVVYNEFDPYGNPIQQGDGAYGYTGEWWQDDVELLHLRARWYSPGTGTFLSKDPWEGDDLRPQSINGWNYAEGNPTNFTDPSGHCIFAPPYDTAVCLLLLLLTSCGTPPEPMPPTPVQRREIDIPVHTLEGIGVNGLVSRLSSFFSYANGKFTASNVMVQVNPTAGRDYNLDETERLIGGEQRTGTGDRDLRLDNQPADETRWQAGSDIDSLLDDTGYVNGKINLYLVGEALSQGLSFKRGDQRGIALDKRASNRTLLHELGHILLDSSVESNHIPNSFMAQDGFANGDDVITPEQAQRIYENASRYQ